MGNCHERRRQSQSPPVRQQLIEARIKPRQRAEQQRQAKTVKRCYGRAFFRRPERKRFSPDIMVPNEKEKEDKIYEPGNNPMRIFVRKDMPGFRYFHLCFAPFISTQHGNSLSLKDYLYNESDIYNVTESRNIFDFSTHNNIIIPLVSKVYKDTE
jgi:hypothetical protein